MQDQILLTMAEDERISVLLQQADRALVMADGEPASPSKGDPTSSVVTVEHLKKVIENLEQKLKTKTALCLKLEATVNKLLLSISNSNGSKQDLSEEYFREVLQAYRAQLWFKKPIPPIVDAISERLRARVEHEYEVDKRRTAFTMTECQTAVSQVRAEWEEAVPPAVVRSLTSDNRVFASASDRSTKAGDPCEAVHYLVYLVFKMYNRAAYALHTLKKKDSMAGGDPMTKMVAVKVDEPTKESEDTHGSMKWYNNPHSSLSKLLVSARRSVYYTRSLHDEESCRNAITVSVSKLMTKPTLNESLELLASIIALNEYAQVKMWRLAPSNFKHRDIFQFKMLEVWNLMQYKEGWSDFRTSFFKTINSLVAYALIARPEIAEALVKQLSSVVKTSNRKEFDASCLALLSEKNIEPLFSFLDKTLAVQPVPEYMTTYGWMFVFLVRFLAIKYDSTMNHETVLFNLIEDLHIDLKLASELEKKDYVRAISIVCSVILGSVNPPSVDEETTRAKCTAAAFFLSSRIGCLLSHTKDGTKFWNESPLPGYRLIDYCEEAALQKVKKHAHLFRLPFFNNAFHDDDDDADFELIESRTEEVASIQSSLGMEEQTVLSAVQKETMNNEVDSKPTQVPTSIHGLKVPALQQMLAERHLSIAGKKGELQQRLIDTGYYCAEAPLKKRKLHSKSGRKSRAEAADSDDSGAT